MAAEQSDLVLIAAVANLCKKLKAGMEQGPALPEIGFEPAPVILTTEEATVAYRLIFEKFQSREKLQLDKSLYSKINATTQKAVDEINAEAQRVLPDALWQREWGSQTTLRTKREYLERYKRRRA